MPTWQVIQGDCLEVLKTLDPASIDAVVTDPPYNVGFSYANDPTGDVRHDYESWCGQWFAQLKKLSSRIVFSCGTNNIPIWAKHEPDWWLAWHKPATMGRCKVGFCNWEPMPFWGDVEQAGCDVIRAEIRPDKSLNGHPCPKPLSWAVQLVKMLAPQTGTVLDPFCGSGTVGVACMQLGVNFIGIEIDPTYCDIARRRIAEAANHLFADIGKDSNEVQLPDS